jgi:hypothetical protein
MSEAAHPVRRSPADWSSAGGAAEEQGRWSDTHDPPCRPAAAAM